MVRLFNGSGISSKLNTCLNTVEESLDQIAPLTFIDDEDDPILVAHGQDIVAAFESIPFSERTPELESFKKLTDDVFSTYHALKEVTKESQDRVAQVATRELSGVLAIETAMKHNISLPAVSAKLNNPKDPQEYFHALVTDREQRIATQKQQAKEVEAYRKSRGTPRIGARF